jgi:hypothetical protein
MCFLRTHVARNVLLTRPRARNVLLRATRVQMQKTC